MIDVMKFYTIILGFTTRNWFKTKLNHTEVLLALEEMAKFHACGLAYRMSLKVINSISTMKLTQ